MYCYGKPGNRFYVPAIDDAISQGKTLRFTHDPRLPIYQGSALANEWNYMQSNYEYGDLIHKAGGWYATKTK